MSFFDEIKQNKCTINGSSLSSRFTLMNQDIPLIDIDEDSGDFNVYEENYQWLPYALKDVSKLNYLQYVNWAVNRVLLLDRVNTKKLLNICGISQSNKYEIAKACRLLSIDDCFWLKGFENEKWECFNLRQNSLSSAVAQVALTGEYVTISGDVTTPEFTNQGLFPKSWKREGDNLFLYKRNLYAQESKIEVLCSNILDKLCIDHIKYEMVDNITCKCICMTNERLSRLNFGEFEEYSHNKGFSAIKWVLDNYPKQFKQMLIVDYLLANTDRHGGNWGFYISNDNNIIQGLHPLYDHNNAFDEKFNDSWGSTVIPGQSMFTLAVEAQKELDLDLSVLLKINEEQFLACGVDSVPFFERIHKLLTE